MARKKSVKRKYTRRAKGPKLVRKSKQWIAAEALKASQNNADYYQRQVGNLNTQVSSMAARAVEFKAEIVWLKQLVQNLEQKIGKGVVVTNA